LKDQRNGFRGAFRGGSRMSQGATTRSGEIGTQRGNDVHPFLALHREMYRMFCRIIMQQNGKWAPLLASAVLLALSR
jgi:hypothetical protein